MRCTGGPGAARASSTIYYWPELARADRPRAEFAELRVDRLLACIWTQAATGHALVWSLYHPGIDTSKLHYLLYYFSFLLHNNYYHSHYIKSGAKHGTLWFGTTKLLCKRHIAILYYILFTPVIKTMIWYSLVQF